MGVEICKKKLYAEEIAGVSLVFNKIGNRRYRVKYIKNTEKFTTFFKVG